MDLNVLGPDRLGSVVVRRGVVLATGHTVESLLGVVRACGLDAGVDDFLASPAGAQRLCFEDADHAMG